VLPESPPYLAHVAESPYAQEAADMGEIYSNPASVPVVATSDHPLLGGSGESRLKNPLRKICTAGSVRGESKMGHGGPKRARSWKRRIGPRKAYRLWRSPLLGDTYRPAFSFAMTPLRLAPAGCCSSTRSELCVTGHRLPSAPHEHPGPWN